MRLSIAVVCAFAVTLLAATARLVADEPYANYACEDGTHFAARFGKDAAHITLSDGSVVELPLQMSGSGFRYASAQYELRGKGNGATWTVGRRVPTDCTASE